MLKTSNKKIYITKIFFKVRHGNSKNHWNGTQLQRLRLFLNLPIKDFF